MSAFHCDHNKDKAEAESSDSDLIPVEPGSFDPDLIPPSLPNRDKNDNWSGKRRSRSTRSGAKSKIRRTENSNGCNRKTESSMPKTVTPSQDISEYSSHDDSGDEKITPTQNISEFSSSSSEEEEDSRPASLITSIPETESDDEVDGVIRGE